MKLKSYLRGLGIGIVVTTIILVIAFNGRNKTMTDAQVMERARELGMVETSMFGNGETKENSSATNENNTSESSNEGMIALENETQNQETEKNTSMDFESDTERLSEPESESTKEIESTTQKETTTEEVTTKETTTKETPTKETTTEETTSQEETTKIPEATTSGKEIVLVFENITSATKASNILYDAGVIQNVESFNAYLSENGLATKVGEGTFTFKKGMSFEEIAKIITRQQ